MKAIGKFGLGRQVRQLVSVKFERLNMNAREIYDQLADDKDVISEIVNDSEICASSLKAMFTAWDYSNFISMDVFARSVCIEIREKLSIRAAKQHANQIIDNDNRGDLYDHRKHE